MFIGIVADDLTGSADSVAPFAQRGYAAGVGLSVEAWAQGMEQVWDALALNTELRDQNDLTQARIASISRRATRRLIERAPQIYFKKIDSTLRGHLQPELEGMRRELPDRVALICPASPANGRTVEEGVLYVHGVPLAATEFVGRAAEPERFSTVRSSFGMSDDPTARAIRLPLLRQDFQSTEAELARLIAGGVRTFFCDAVTPDDLRVLARIVLHRSERYLPVGSAGFTRALAELLPLGSATTSWETERFTQGRVLVVVGSLHPMSRRQAQRLMGGANVRPMVLERKDGLDILGFEWDFRRRYQAGDRLFILTTPEERSAKSSRYPLEQSLLMLSKWADSPSPFDAFVATGGQTAQQLCHALQGRELQIYGESEPGIVRAILNREQDLPGVPMILKAGGFGDEATLARCAGIER